MNNLAYFNRLRHEKAIEAYLANPSICLHCGSVIPLAGHKVTVARAKKFCNLSCAAIYNNRVSPKQRKKVRYCKVCKAEFYGRTDQRFCESCASAYRERCARKTKAEVSRKELSSHAVSVMNGRRKACQQCGYSRFVEMCHVKPVRNFSLNASVKEINDPSNLVYLCPNCHWEFDHGMLVLNMSSS